MYAQGKSSVLVLHQLVIMDRTAHVHSQAQSVNWSDSFSQLLLTKFLSQMRAANQVLRPKSSLDNLSCETLL